MITLSDLIVWLVVGALAGSLTGMLITRTRAGFGRWTNFGVGLVGALIGGLFFHFFEIDLGLQEIRVSLEDLVAAVLGSLLFLGALWFWQEEVPKLRQEVGKLKGSR